MTATTVPGRTSTWERVRSYQPPARYLPMIATLALLVGIFGFGSARFDGFGDPQVVLNLFVDNAHLIVLAVGVTFVILTGGIDLSVGAMLALSTIIAARGMAAGWPAPLACLVVLAAGALLGLLQGLVIQYLDVQPFIATLAGMFLARGLCYLLAPESIPIQNQTFRDFASASVDLPGGYYVNRAVVIAIVVLLIAMWVLHRTRFGRTVYAIGGNESSALLMGLRVPRVKVSVYVISGLCSAVGGLLFALSLLSGYSLHGVGMELDAIAAVVIGGTLLTGGSGLVFGSMLGVLVLGAIQAYIDFDGTLNSWWTRIATGILLLGFVMVQRFVTRRQST
jgi:simple sugar transport system permease protein